MKLTAYQLQALRDQTLHKLGARRHQLLQETAWLAAMTLGASGLGLQSSKVRHLSRYVDRLVRLRNHIDWLHEEANN